MRYFLISFFFLLASCQYSARLESWFDSFKDHTLTEMASQNSRGLLTELQKAQVLVLFLDMEETESCPQLVELAESNQFSEEYGESHGMQKGFLFDIFYSYTYESLVFSGLDLREKGERLAWIIANTWKTKFSTKRINAVLADLKRCYPY